MCQKSSLVQEKEVNIVGGDEVGSDEVVKLSPSDVGVVALVFEPLFRQRSK